MSSRKRQKTSRAFGAPSEADNPVQNLPSSSSSSSRTLPLKTVPTLTTLCARRFVSQFIKLRSNLQLWDLTTHYLKLLPEAIVPKLFTMIRGSHLATYIPHEIIVTYFLQGPSLTLTDSLPGVNKNTVLSIGRINPHLRELELSGFAKFADETFASTISHLNSLRSLVLRGCTRVSNKTVDTIIKSCPELRIINLNYTSVTPLSVAALVTSCHELEVLKLAGISNWTDATFAKFTSALDEKTCLPNLHTLKLRELSLSDNSLATFVSLCPTLKRLDVSFTLIKHPQIVISDKPPALEKLSLTSTAVTGTDLVSTIVQLPHLKTLSLGALGVRQSSKASISNSSAMSMNDSTLRNLVDILEGFQQLQSINLVSNTKLGGSSRVDSALFDFIRRVGRKCQYLNLSNLSSLRSDDLAALLPLDDQDDVPSLRTLVLNNVSIDDDASAFLACCCNLSRLEISGTKLTKQGVFAIIDSCPELQYLDVTSCRGISITDRRRIFDVWKEERKDE